MQSATLVFKYFVTISCINVVGQEVNNWHWEGFLSALSTILKQEPSQRI